MKNLINLFIVFGFLSCGQVATKSNDHTSNQDSINIDKEIFENREEDDKPTLQLPIGFRLDTIQVNDTSRNLSIFISIPISGINRIDKVVSDNINKLKNDFVKDIDELIQEDRNILNSINSDFQAIPISVYKGNKVTSILYIVSIYQAGAVHPLTSYYSFNFDNLTQRRLFFSDYFDVKSTTDTILMTDQITKSIGREGIFVSELNNLDFSIEKDTISFNFSEYDIASYAERIIQGRIQKIKLYDKIKKTYR